MADVIIMGAGPAGSTLGCYLSMAGIDHTILEKAIHPRAHVGESMLMTPIRIWEEIGFLRTMEAEGFPRKFGASWHPSHKVEEVDIAFREFPQPGINQDYTYHVDRSKYDLLLMKHAERLGSEICTGVAVKEVLFDDGRATGVRALLGDREITLDAKVVVDATGRDTLLGRQLKLKKNDPVFDQYAVHAWYADVDRGKGDTRDYIHIYFLPVKRGWAWQIPITDQITSMGVVAEREVFRDAKLDVEAYFDKYVSSNPNLADAMRPARRINEFKREGDYSYSMSSFCGNGFVMLGDAARFVDPIFSSGVSVAMYSAKFASERIRRAFETGDFSVAAFQPYENKIKNGVSIWYDFIRLYYKLLPLFTKFIKDQEHRIGLLQLLQGDVYERTEIPPVLNAMREYVKAVEETPGHILRKYLSDVPVG
jgi:FADH2 O2-dependent halogenase